MAEDARPKRMATRLRGGGGDGGVYPLTHAEMQWMTPSEMGTSGGGCHSNATKDKASEGMARFDRARVCAASSKPLKEPVVICDLGHLLNKEDVLELLLAKALPPHLAHIRSLKSLHDAKLHANPAFVAESGHKQGAEDDEPPFYCPIAMIPMNGRYPFVYIKPTGHVVSQRALKQVGGRLCPITEKTIGADDSIPINPSDDERKLLQDKLAAKKALAAESKRKLKAEASATATAIAPATAPASAPATAAISSGGSSSSAAASAATSSGSAAATNKSDGKRALDGGGGGGGKRAQREWDKVVEAKASASSVYKSLFLSAEERAKQQAQETANFCARGIVPSLSRSTKFGLG